MTKKCELTGKNPMKGHNVSHANNKTKRRFLPNLKKVKFTSELLKRSLKLTVSNAGVRSVDKKGSFDEFLKSVKNKNLSPRLKKLKKSLLIKSPFFITMNSPGDNLLIFSKGVVIPGDHKKCKYLLIEFESIILSISILFLLLIRCKNL